MSGAASSGAAKRAPVSRLLDILQKQQRGMLNSAAKSDNAPDSAGVQVRPTRSVTSVTPASPADAGSAGVHLGTPSAGHARGRSESCVSPDKTTEACRDELIAQLLEMGYPKSYVMEVVGHVDVTKPNAIQRCFNWMEKHPLAAQDVQSENQTRMVNSLVEMGFAK